MNITRNFKFQHQIFKPIEFDAFKIIISLYRMLSGVLTPVFEEMPARLLFFMHVILVV